jgi:hypothetical protein
MAREYMLEVDKFCDESEMLEVDKFCNESEEGKPMDIAESQDEKIISGNCICEYLNNMRSLRDQ